MTNLTANNRASYAVGRGPSWVFMTLVETTVNIFPDETLRTKKALPAWGRAFSVVFAGRGRGRLIYSLDEALGQG